MKRYRIAVVGATGMVGRMFLKVLEEYNLEADYTLFASQRSAGSGIEFFRKTHIVEELGEASFDRGFDIAFFSVEASESFVYAPIAAAKGCVVIDNSSCWRMEPGVPLVVPEVNPEDIRSHRGIIANPNCSTIQAVVALKPLHDRYRIKRVVYSTYQAVSGAGAAGCEELEASAKGLPPKKFAHPIYNNCLPHIDSFLENGYTKEEEKMANETRKILGEPNMRITATTVRVPVMNGHSESVNVEFELPFELPEARKILENAPGIVMRDDPANAVYPIATEATGKDGVFVGRLRRDFSVESGLNMWIVADNVRKGAASNAVQIALRLLADRRD